MQFDPATAGLYLNFLSSMEEPFEPMGALPFERVSNDQFGGSLVESKIASVAHSAALEPQITCVLGLEFIDPVCFFPAMSRHPRQIRHLKEMIGAEWIDLFTIDSNRIVRSRRSEQVSRLRIRRVQIRPRVHDPRLAVSPVFKAEDVVMRMRPQAVHANGGGAYENMTIDASEYRKSILAVRRRPPLAALGLSRNC